MNLKSTILIAGAMLAGVTAMAVPARRDVRTVTQPDGTTLQVRLIGDEFAHQLLTADGMLLTQNPVSGAYEYATLDAAGRLSSLGVQAVDASVRPAAQQELVVKFTPELAKSARAAAPRRSIAQSGMGRYTSDFPRKGDVKVLVILVEYQDVKCTISNPEDHFRRMLNEKGYSDYGATGSCADYFSDNSLGQFRPQFDFYGPVTLPQKRAYYGGNNLWTKEDEAPEQMVADACRLLDSQIDFSQYDNDGDGKVDNVYLYYAGQGEADFGPAESVWPHAWELTSAGINLKLDGVVIDRYACSNEWDNSMPAGIGTFIHEFSHVMGLPDLYTTDYGEDYVDLTPGAYSVMDYGPYNNDGRTPPAYSIYERNAMTWMEPEVIDDACSATLENILTSNKGYIIPTLRDNEFYLLENRQQSSWDAYIPGHGMIIWHVDFDQSVWDENIVNNDEHQYVDIVEACGRADNYDDELMKGYTWPGTQNKREFTANTVPALRDWNGNAIDLPLTDITEKNGVITFLVDGGPQPMATPRPMAPSEWGDDFFVASWGAVANATDYEVKLYEASDAAGTTVVANMGSGSKLQLPNGWKASQQDVYTTDSNYGNAAPSLKLSQDGAWLETEQWDSEIQKISFWYKGQQNGDSKLNVLGLENGSWVTLKSIVPAKNEAQKCEITSLPAGVTALRLVWNKVRGNIAIDDVTVTLGGGYTLRETIPSTGGTTSVRFENLPTKKYYFTVAATDGEFTTRHSAPAYVDLSTTGVSAIETEAAAPEYFDMLGRRILNPAPGTICIERRGAKTVKRVIR